MTTVFLSWSGARSKRIAEELRIWIPSVLQFAKPYYTPSDIEKGAKWGSEISKKLSESNVGIICLTKENFSRPWILFEAGALSKDIDQSRVCSVLFGMENAELSGPLTTFQTTEFSKSDFKKLMKTVNESGGDSALSSETFNGVFEMWWPRLEGNISQILQESSGEEPETQRTDRDILEEILLISRQRIRDSSRAGFIPEKLILDLLDVIESVHGENEEFMSGQINDSLRVLIKMAVYLDRKSSNKSEGFEERVASIRQRLDGLMQF